MGSSKAKDGKSSASNDSLDCGKYARYTQEQVEILERVYNDCPKPSSSRRQQLIRECPTLANIGHKQLKVWFQNRRYVFVEICIDVRYPMYDVCMYARMYICIYMYVCVCVHACMHVRMYVCLVYACLYVCIYVSICVVCV